MYKSLLINWNELKMLMKEVVNTEHVFFVDKIQSEIN
jgi:hypothetical protein